MKFTILPRYLIGSREAIRDVATSPIALVCSIIFVISAGFAREYDGEDLVHEPWHVLRPLGASLASGTVLFLIVHGVATARPRDPAHPRPSLWTAYRTFMTLFWMTAPLAWLYAIPYERFMSPVDAVGANLWTLALVAAWRVFLITRVISVVYGTRILPTFFLVMLFADAVAFAVVTLIPTPVIDVMGGLRHTERDALISSVTFTVTILSVLSAPLWLVGGAVAAALFRPRWPKGIWIRARPDGRGMLIGASISVAIWIPALVLVQPEQMNRHRAEWLMKSGLIVEGVAFMSELEPADFPPYWDPPPRLGYGEHTPEAVEIALTLQDARPSEWVQAVYFAKVRRVFLAPMFIEWDPPDWERVLPEFSDEPNWRAEYMLEHADEGRFLIEHDATIPDVVRDELRSILVTD